MPIMTNHHVNRRDNKMSTETLSDANNDHVNRFWYVTCTGSPTVFTTLVNAHFELSKIDQNWTQFKFTNLALRV